MFKPIHFTAVTIFSAVLLSGGCQQQTPPVVAHGEDFPPDTQPTHLERIDQSQASSGAVSDGTLYACHFSGDSLNSLGTSKLDLILKGSGSSPVTVWMSAPDDASVKARQAAVLAYLSNRGLSADRIRLASTENLATGHPAAQGIKDLIKTDSDTSGGGQGSASSNASTPGSH